MYSGEFSLSADSLFLQQLKKLYGKFGMEEKRYKHL